MLKVTYMNKSIFKENYKENDRLIDGEKADYARSCRRQILAAFLGKIFYIFVNVLLIIVFYRLLL